MKKALLIPSLSNLLCLRSHHKQQKYNRSWQLALCLMLTLLQQTGSAQTIPNENSPNWLWVKSAGGPGADQATGVTTNADGNVYTIGTFNNTATFGNQTLTSAGATDIFITKHDADGNLIWAKRAGGTGNDQPNKVITDATGNIYVAGNTSGAATFGNITLVNGGIFIAKYNPVGDVLWAKAEGNAGFKEFNISTSGHLYLGGSFNSSITIGNNTITTDNNNFYNYGSTFIAKYDNAGNVLWATDAGGEGGHAFDVAFDAAGNAYATGIFFDTVVFGDTTFTEPLEWELGYNFIVKYNANGNFVWANQEANLYPNSTQNWIVTDTTGNVYVAGKNYPVPTNEIYLKKYDATGNYLWANNVADSDYAVWIVDLLPDAAGNIYIAYNQQCCGRQSGDFPEISAAFNKFNAAGNLVVGEGIYSEYPPGEYDRSVRASNMVVDAIGRVYFSFSFRGTANIGNDSLITSENEVNAFSAIYDTDGTFLSVHKLTVTNLAEKGNNTYLAGSFKDTVTIGNTTLTSNGDTDAFLAKILYGPHRERQTITFAGIPKKTVDSAPFPLVASSSSGLPVTFSIVSGPAKLKGNTLTITGTGNVTIKASQAGNADYLAAPDVINTFQVLPKGIPVQLVDKTFGGNNSDLLSAIVPTADGGYLLGGYSNSNVSSHKSQPSRGSYDYWVVKVDENNNKIWDKTFGGSDSEQLLSMIATADGGFLLGGYSYSGTSGDKSQANRKENLRSTDYWVVKINANGDKVWDKTFGGGNFDYLRDIIATADGGYLLGGTSYSDKSGDKGEPRNSDNAAYADYWVVKINANGNKVWDKTFGGNKDDHFGNIVATADGNYLLGGSSNSEISGNKSVAKAGYWAVKIDARGTKLWDKIFSGGGKLITIPDGGYLLASSSSANKGGDKSEDSRGATDYWVVRVDDNGNKIWDKTFGGTSYENLGSLLATSDGGFLLGGSSMSEMGADKSEVSRENSLDYWVVKIDARGNKVWDQTYGGNRGDNLTALTTLIDGSYVLAGYSESDKGFEKSEDNLSPYNSEPDYWVVKIKEEATPPPPVSTWNQTYGGKSFERLTSVLKASDGGYLLGGHSLSQHGGDRTQDTRGRYDFWLVKTDAFGVKLWDKRYGGNDDDYLNQIIPTADGGYLLAGSSKSSVGGDKTTINRGNQDFWIVKVDANGNKLWDQTYGGSGFEDLIQVVQLSTGEYVLAGVSDSDISGEKSQNRRGSRDFWLMKISATGVKLWDKCYGGSKAEELSSLLITGDGGFVLGGSSLSSKSGEKTSASKGGKDYWIVRTDGQGNLFWDKSYGGNGEDQLTALTTTTAGGLLLAGHSSSGVSGNKSSATRGSSDYWLVKTDATGTKLWDKTYGGNGEEELASLIATHDNGWLLGGSSFSNQSGEKSQNSQGSSDYWVVKTNEEGEPEWDQTYGGSGEERLRYLLQTEDDGFLLGGFSFSDQSGDKSQDRQGRSDYWLVKIPPLPATQTRIAAQPAVEVATPAVTESFKAYPVPAKEKVTVQFTLPQTQPAIVQLYNSQGAKVKTLFQGEVQAHKTYQVEWQPTSHDGNGLYLLQIQAKHQKQTLKILLQK